MNYLHLEKKCSENGTTPTALCKKLELSKGNSTSWKKGGNPSVEILGKLADELNCTTDYLLGRETAVNQTGEIISKQEKTLLDSFRQLNEQNLVDCVRKRSETFGSTGDLNGKRKTP